MRVQNDRNPQMADMGIMERNQFTFDNGYGASVIRFANGLHELAVLEKNGEITYTTDITEDVVSSYSEETILLTLAYIATLD